MCNWLADQLVTFFAPSLPVWKWHCMKQSVGLMKPLFLPALLPLLSYTMVFDNETLYRINWTTFSPHLYICLVPGYHGILSITENNYLLLITWKILESFFCHQQSSLYPNQCLSWHVPTFATCQLTFMRPTPESILGRTLLSKYSPTVGTAIECYSRLYDYDCLI